MSGSRIVCGFGAKKDQNNLDPSYRAWPRHMAAPIIMHMFRLVRTHRAWGSRSRGNLGPVVTGDCLWEQKLLVLIFQKTKRSHGVCFCFSLWCWLGGRGAWP